jgi:hypothetical protein
MGLTVSVSDRHLFVALNDVSFESDLTRHAIEA